MRVQISFDSASTEQVRDMCVALHRIGKTGTLQVGVNGPECWSGTTPHLTENEWAKVVSHLVKIHGETINEAVINGRVLDLKP